MGLDSMTLLQFKGVLEKRFYCDIPDDFLFTGLATLEQLALAVQGGQMTEEQRVQYEGMQGEAGGAEVDPNAPSTVMVQRQEPCCPWFTCCL
ncbi:hypothetical protein B484DRAFT_164417 [Ochromonadaceae sp. CCMP2298]|nr:hypothetical protein B484DRAFT_164417 [Ochromonadaceae sp. CCMP2298]